MTGKSILITSGKGGVGKTTSTANIAVALTEHRPDLKVCIIDMDIGLRNLDIQFGLENQIVYNIVDYLEGTCTLEQALLPCPNMPNLLLLPAAQTKDKNAIQPEQMLELVKKLKEDYDFILLDCPAGIEQGFHNSAIGADEAIIITNPEIPAIRDADRVIGILESFAQPIPCWLIINRFNPSMVKLNEMMSIEDILDILGLRLLGVVPEDSSMISHTNNAIPIASDKINNWAGLAYRNIAKRLLGEDMPLLDLFPKKETLLQASINKVFGLFIKK